MLLNIVITLKSQNLEGNKVIIIIIIIINRENNHERNKRFQLPLIPTANQILWHCSNSQSALRSKSGRNELKLVRVCIRPNF